MPAMAKKEKPKGAKDPYPPLAHAQSHYSNPFVGQAGLCTRRGRGANVDAIIHGNARIASLKTRCIHHSAEHFIVCIVLLPWNFPTSPKSFLISTMLLCSGSATAKGLYELFSSPNLTGFLPF
eukprot:Gb_16013 [translate_table: standard]